MPICVEDEFGYHIYESLVSSLEWMKNVELFSFINFFTVSSL